jgi:hypothetical protein
MPFVKRLPRAALALAAFLVTAAMPAAANATGCPTAATTKAFSAFGDVADYALAPAGALEGGATGWSLTGASVVSGNETYKVHGSTDTSSLAVQPTGKAVSPAFCVSIAQPTFRFFARRTNGTWGTLNVIVRWTDSSGASHDTTAGSISASDLSWHPSPVLALSSMLPLWQSGSTLSVRIVFDPEDYGGAWAIDDLYIDPYSR